MFVFLKFLTFKLGCYYVFLHFSTLLVYGKHKLGSSTIVKIGKTAFTVEFLTVANNFGILATPKRNLKKG